MHNDDGIIPGTERFRPSSIERAEAELDQGAVALDALLTPTKRHTQDLLALARAQDSVGFWQTVDKDILAGLYTSAPTAWQAFRAEVKLACRGINVRELDAIIKPPAEESEGFSAELADLAASRCELWRDADRNAFASYEVGDHREHWPIDSTGFKEWLAWLAHSELKKAASSEVLRTCVNALSGAAKFDGKEHAPAMRVAKTPEGYWLDVGSEDWRAILVTPTGWHIVPHPSIKFVRTKTTRPLPQPARDGSVDLLWSLVNVPEGDRLLVLAWILECYRADTPYALLELTGEQGAAKSSAQRILREFVDPNRVALRGRPKTVEDIFVSAANSHLLSFENLSGLSNDQSDALCTVATGGGYSSRQFFTNGEESVLKAHNPVVLNGISPVVLRPDLLDRAVSINLPNIERRLTEGEIQHRVAEAAPGIMGGLLTLFADALRILPQVTIDAADLPRMADFTRLGEAIARVLGHAEGDFLAIYTEHRREAIGRTIEASPVAAALVDFVERGGSHRGLVKGLLDQLNEIRPPQERDDYWPRSPKGLADAMRRYAPALRQAGIVASVETRRRNDGIHCRLNYDSSRGAFPGGFKVHNVHDIHAEVEI